MLYTAFEQRRRIVFFALSMAIGLYLLDLKFGASVLGSIGWLAAATLMCALFSIAFVSLFKRWRGALECTGIGVLIGSFVGAFTPFGVYVAIPLSVIVGGALGALFYGSLQTRLSWRPTLTMRASSHIPGPDSEVWSVLIPGESDPEDFFNGRVEAFEKDPEDHETLYVSYMGRGGSPKDLTVSFLNKEKNRKCSYYFDLENADGHLSEGQRDITITSLDQVACHVDLQESHYGLPLGTVIMRWFDNPLANDLRILDDLFSGIILYDDPDEPDETEPAAQFDPSDVIQPLRRRDAPPIPVGQAANDMPASAQIEDDEMARIMRRVEASIR